MLHRINTIHRKYYITILHNSGNYSFIPFAFFASPPQSNSLMKILKIRLFESRDEGFFQAFNHGRGERIKRTTIDRSPDFQVELQTSTFYNILPFPRVIPVDTRGWRTTRVGCNWQPTSETLAFPVGCGDLTHCLRF